VIKAMVFDLDGTLVQTERLKALSYACAAIELCPYALAEPDAVAAFKELVGRPRREVAQGLIERFGLYEAARSRMAEFSVDTPWQAFVQVRMRYYEAMLADPEVLRNHPGRLSRWRRGHRSAADPRIPEGGLTSGKKWVCHVI
jgi:beta-phosphoglucomutase